MNDDAGPRSLRQALMRLLQEPDFAEQWLSVSGERSKQRACEALCSLCEDGVWDRAHDCAMLAISEIPSSDDIKKALCATLSLSYLILVISLINFKNETMTRADKGLRLLEKTLGDYPEAAEVINRKLAGNSKDIESIIAESRSEVDRIINFKKQVAAICEASSAGRPKDMRSIETLRFWEIVKPGGIGMRTAARCMAKFLTFMGWGDDEGALAETLYQTIRNHENSPVNNTKE